MQKNTITLNNNLRIPAVGLGLWKAGKGQEAEKAVLYALDAGYRHFDTAKVYDNEEELGNAISNCGIDRGEVFITTKVWNDDQGYDNTMRAFEASLKRLQMDYVDLYLVHWPFLDFSKRGIDEFNKREKTWKALEALYDSGRARSIGVCNYNIEHFEEMKNFAKLVPAVNQIELHPFWNRKELNAFCQEHNILVEGYCPLARAKRMDDPVISSLAKKHGKTNAQVMIRWSLQLGNVVLPKSVRKERIIENIQVFDFELTSEDMAALNALNEDYSAIFS